jgi:YegS/Rv2252/BmrU family lipid kinase
MGPPRTPTALPPDPTARRRALIIINPAAGRSRRTGAWLGQLTQELGALGCDALVRHATDPGDVERLARDAKPEFDVIAVGGGDGTINAAVNGTSGSARPLALLPLGTANVLAREIGLPRAPAALARLIVFGAARPVWPGRIGDRLFMTMTSSGFDAEIVAAVNPTLKRYLGRIAFAWAIIAALVRYRHHHLIVQTEHGEHRAAMAIATRTRFYAGPFIIAPQASLAEPALDLVLFQRSGRVAAVCYLLALLCGALPGRADVTMLRTRQAHLTAATALAVQADGEIVGSLPSTIGISHRPLMLICP